MGAIDTRAIRKALTAKGFRGEQSHHQMFFLYVEGKRTQVRTRISHGKREYGDSLLAQMARQVRLQRREFNDLIECPMSGEAYLQLLRERGEVKT